MVNSLLAPLLAASLLALTTVSAVLQDTDLQSDLGSYDSLLLQDLYKRLADIDPNYLLSRSYEDDNMAPVDDAGAPDYDDSEFRSIQRSPVAGGQTESRDSEYIGHSSNAGSQGFIYMSGGAGEGQQHLTPSGALKNIHQVKSDESLPFYCHPPNPCPKGYTAENGCQESIEDTAEMQKTWIEKMMQKGLCSCDEEHMYDCPASSDRAEASQTPSSSGAASSEQQQAFNDVIDKILGDKAGSAAENPFVGGQKRQSLVAKKSPRVKRDQPDDRIEKELDKLTVKDSHNPYLAGEKLRTVAKKGFPSASDRSKKHI